MSPKSDVHAEAARLIDAIELELRRMGVWQAKAPPKKAMAFKEAFGRDRLTFYQWLQFVLVPRVRSILAGDGEFPRGSAVGAYAIRELDGNTDASDLRERLSEFDALFDDEPSATPETPGDEPDFSQAIFAVRGFLIGIQVGNANAARSHLTRPQRDDVAFQPAIEFEIHDFRTGDAEAHGDCAVVRTHIEGKSPTGDAASQDVPFVVVREDGAWRIHLDRTAGMAMTGDPHAGAGAALENVMKTAVESMAGAMDAALSGVGAATSSAFDDSNEEDFKAELVTFDETTRPQLESDLSGRFGVPVKIEVDWSGSERRAMRVQELGSFLGNEFLSAVSAASDPGKAFLIDGLARVAVGFSPRCAERGFRRDGDALRVVVDPQFGHAPSWPVMARILELTADPAVREQFASAWERAGLLRDTLRESHGIDVPVEPNWQTFTRGYDSGVNAWALYRLAENALAPFAEGIDALFTADTKLRDAARESLREIVIETAEEPGERKVALDEGTLSYTLFVSETHAEYWSAEELRERLSEALGGSGPKRKARRQKSKKSPTDSDP